MPFNAVTLPLTEEQIRAELAKQAAEMKAMSLVVAEEEEEDAPTVAGILAWNDHRNTVTHKNLVRDYKRAHYINIPNPPSYYHYLDFYHRQNQGGASLPDVPLADGKTEVALHLLLPEHDISHLKRIPAWVNHGRWVWECPRCNAAYIAERLEHHPHNEHILAICAVCIPEWHIVEFPDNYKEIEDKLMEMKGQHLDLAPAREWRPGWTMDKLQARNDRASEILQGDPTIVTIRNLSIGTTRRWAVGEHLTSANLIMFTSNILDDLAGRNGKIEFESNIALEPTTTLPTKEGEMAYLPTGKQFIMEMGVSGTNEERRVVAIPRSAFAHGGIVYLDIRNESGFSVLPAGTTGQVLTMQAGRPVWQ